MHQLNSNPPLQDDSFLNANGNATDFDNAEIEAYKEEFNYENAEGLTGIPYINYLRSNDDML